MQITINIPDQQIDRIKPWVEKFMAQDENGVTVPYTNAELLAKFKEILRGYIKGEVQQHELLAQHEAVYANYTPIEVTE